MLQHAFRRELFAGNYSRGLKKRTSGTITDPECIDANDMTGIVGVNQKSCRLTSGKKVLGEVNFETIGVELCISRRAI
jgi:hypothetical protein